MKITIRHTTESGAVRELVVELEEDLLPSNVRSLVEDLFGIVKDQPQHEQHVMIDPKVLRNE